MNLEDYSYQINSQLVDYCLRGIIPGPEEALSDYLLRAKKIESKNPDSKVCIDGCVWRACQLISDLYGISEIKAKIFRSNKNLLPWEGGATWISDHEVTIQLSLRRRWPARSNYTEILTHEFVHIMRQKFNEPIFEELIAYQSSPKCWRRILGPFLAQSWRCFLLLGSFVLGQIADWILLSYHWTLIVTSLVILPLVTSTGIRHYQFQKVKKMIASSFWPSFANFMMLFLTDREIIRFSKLGQAEILKYLKSGKTLRLKALSLFIC